jgi:hypothetical protein
MSPSPRSLALASPHVAHVKLLPIGHAFLRVPAAHGAVDTAWLAPVIHGLLDRHQRVLVLLESELMGYFAHAGTRDVEALPPPLADDVSATTMARWHEVDAIRKAMPAALMPRVQIAIWSTFIDATFASIWRQLLTAFARPGVFRRDVQHRARSSRRPADVLAAGSQNDPGAAFYRIESLAMQLRVGEVAGYHHEYGPGGEGVLSARLYAGVYARDALTVESLVSHPPQRIYNAL